MEIVLALLFGAVAGLLVHYTLPGRDTRGAALAPLIGAVVGGGVWMVLTWLGWTTDNGWLWLTSIAAPLVVSYPAVAVLTRRRHAVDDRERRRLRIA
ncbi:hypothetical protein [Microbacterium sp.]|uniref:hypothetical protein n=1 Tax=Microbacterium sp. TaxID=51671 RepID=UPI000927D5FC|nr:hypothetical protein [Microbacterium sp.]MBN9181627.1 hypothetical protein [Microbacterium sp.]MBN9184542.1 hypothetical protein [Microbacterium sp.]MBN9191688.1 hypothetical protein [Microbacterium sp.]OJU67451.1 MAG: hypothetical protein BGO04_04800 [Microbacterium sp. 70-38]